MFRRLSLPSPAMAVALIALFVALSGTAVAAAVPLAKKALFAGNSAKLQGKTAAEIAATPGPAASVSGLVTLRSADFVLDASQSHVFSITCGPGEKALSGGFFTGANVLSGSSRIGGDGTTFSILLRNPSGTPVTGYVYSVCVG